MDNTTFLIDDIKDIETQKKWCELLIQINDLNVYQLVLRKNSIEERIKYLYKIHELADFTEKNQSLLIDDSLRYVNDFKKWADTELIEDKEIVIELQKRINVEVRGMLNNKKHLERLCEIKKDNTHCFNCSGLIPSDGSMFCSAECMKEKLGK